MWIIIACGLDLRSRAEFWKNYRAAVCAVTKRLAWAGNLIRMSNGRTLKKIFDTKPEGTRSVGRPKLQWEDGVVQDT
jgi:hypothetical protein